MTGDQQDILSRLRTLLPTRWFPDEAPILTGLLSGLASAWSWSYSLLQYVVAQTRITTATDVWLDMISYDYFGHRVVRRAGQGDAAFRDTVRRELLRERGTRAALVSVLQDLTGRTPIVFEPARTTDTGGYGSVSNGNGGMAYGAAGGWGNLEMPFQCFITAYRPTGSGIAVVAGWNGPAGTYGQGAIEYASLAMIQGQITDADIYAAVADVLPVATIAWTAITD
jgi:hypothetical protein